MACVSGARNGFYAFLKLKFVAAVPGAPRNGCTLGFREMFGTTDFFHLRKFGTAEVLFNHKLPAIHAFCSMKPSHMYATKQFIGSKMNLH